MEFSTHRRKQNRKKKFDNEQVFYPLPVLSLCFGSQPHGRAVQARPHRISGYAIQIFPVLPN